MVTTTYAVFGTARRGKAPGVYISNGGYISPTGAIEINRDTAGASHKLAGGLWSLPSAGHLVLSAVWSAISKLFLETKLNFLRSDFGY